MNCTKCKREFVEVLTKGDEHRAIITKKSYIKAEKKHKYVTRYYCAFCGAWIK